MKKFFLSLFMLMAISLFTNSYANEDCDAYAASAAADYYYECDVSIDDALEFYGEMYDYCSKAVGEVLDPIIFC